MARYPPEIESRWRRWLLERNRRGFRSGLVIVATLYPAFGLLDWLLAPAFALPWLWAIRALVLAVTGAAAVALPRRGFEPWVEVASAAYAWLAAVGIATMTTYMGGLASPYYAGLTLVVLAAGLLMVWRPRVVVATLAAIVATFVVANVVTGNVGRVSTALSNLAFLSATALIAGIGQVLLYRTHREQHAQRCQLEEASANLERAHAELQQLDRFKSRFFANITHELRTPLAMVLTPLELLMQGEMGAFTEAQRSSFETMFRNALKLLRLIDDLLDLSRLEESRLSLEVREHELGAWLRALVEQTQVLARRKGIALELSAPDGEVRLSCDLHRLERVFVNLLSNAIKFTPAGGHVRMALADVGGTVEVVVDDDGPGFPPDQAVRIFERFYQVDMAGTRRHGGAGIGLALARELVLLHGGSIAAESDGVHGARFVVRLPRAAAPATSPGPEPEPDAVERDGRERTLDWSVHLASRKDLRLLDIEEATERRAVDRDPDEHSRRYTAVVVEDHPQVVQLVHMSLRREFRVLTAPDGLKGLELVQREPPTLVVTDRMMPGIDGLELVRRLRADPRTRHVPILMLTARRTLDDRVKGLEGGVDAYLTKPFSPKELLTTARQLVQAKEQTAALVLDRSMDSLELVAAGLAHEMNNPLNYVRNSLARVRLDAEKVLETASRADAGLGPEDRAAVDRLAKRIREMLGVADSGLNRIGRTVDLMGRYGRGFRHEIRPEDAWEAVRTVVDVVLPATGRAVDVRLELEGDGAIECVPEELNQLVTNLVQNAIEAAPEADGRVWIRGRVDGDDLVLSVKDNGPGIAPEVRARLFTPFFTTKGPGRGQGLGLTISRRVVQGLGGSLEVAGAPGEGAEFVARLPRRQRARAAPEPARAEGAATSPGRQAVEEGTFPDPLARSLSKGERR